MRTFRTAIEEDQWLEYSFTKIDELQTATEDIQESIVDIAHILEQISINTYIITESLDIFMLLDQIYINTIELHSGIEQLIQDLVLANTGSVTSTLLITRLFKIINTAKIEWNFQLFSDTENIALYYPLLNSYLNDTSTVLPAWKCHVIHKLRRQKTWFLCHR